MADNDPLPFAPTTPSANGTNSAFLLGVAGLLTLAVAWAVWRGALLWLLVLAPPAALAWLLLVEGSTKLGNWLTEKAFTIITVPLMGWLLGALLLWLLVNTGWAAEQSDVVRAAAPLPVAGVPLTAAVVAPAISLRDTPGALAFSFGTDAGASLPETAVKATITLPPELAFAEAPGPATRAHAIPLNGSLAERRVAIVNSGRFAGLRTAVAPIVVELCPPAGPCRSLTLAARVEGAQGFAIRRFITSTVNQASPLILLLLLVTPGVAALVQRLISERSRALTEQKQDKFERLVKEFRERIYAGDLDGARTTRKTIAHPSHRLWNEEALAISDALLQLASLEFKDARQPDSDQWPRKDLLKLGQRWPEAFAGAYCIARLTLKEMGRPGDNERKANFRRYYNKEDQVAQVEVDPGLVDQARRFVQAARYDLQYQQFANDPVLEIRLASWAADHSDSLSDILPTQPRSIVAEPPLPGYVIGTRTLAFPYERLDARHRAEQHFLFAPADCNESSSQTGYFGPRELVEPLARPVTCLIVHGPPGCGRSAMAGYLHYNGIDPERLLVRLSGPPEPTAIAQTIARKYLRFILLHPTRLEEYGPGEQRLLARLFVTYLGSHVVPALEDGQITLREVRGLKEPKDEETARRQLEEFKRVVIGETARRATLPRPREQDPLATTAWLGPLQEGARILNFSELILAYDGQGDEPWLANQVLSRLEEWAALGVAFRLFMPDSQFQAPSGHAHHLDHYELIWTEELLRRMIEWRYERYLCAGKHLSGDNRGRDALKHCFDSDETYTRLIHAGKVGDAYNPRRFMELWLRAVGKKEIGATIDAQAVAAALEDGNWATP